MLGYIFNHNSWIFSLAQDGTKLHKHPHMVVRPEFVLPDFISEGFLSHVGSPGVTVSGAAPVESHSACLGAEGHQWHSLRDTLNKMLDKH